MNTDKSKCVIALGMIIISIAFIIIAQGITLPARCEDTFTNTTYNSTITKDGFYFDTYISITAYDVRHEKTLAECIDICAKLEKTLSRTDEDSELYKLNQHNKTAYEVPYKLSPTLYECIQETLEYSEVFGNKYSILAGDLCDVWDYEQKTIPDAHNISQCIEAIQAYHISLSDASISLIDTTVEHSPTDSSLNIHAVPSIDLGASAKGFIANTLCKYLKSNGVSDAIIDLGGNIVVIGDKIDNSMYKIGIKKPFSETNEVAAVCKIADTSLVTSGIYERYFTVDQKIYHHIIDCETGYPTDNNILSVTIITPNALQADCYSTGCLLLGADDALALINSTDNVECIIIDIDYNIHLSDGLTYDNNYIVLK